MGKCAVCFKKVKRGTGPFFQVPSDDKKRLLWGNRCRKRFNPKDIICRDHFSPEVMICCGNQYRLLPIAIPHPSIPGTISANSLPAVQQKRTDWNYPQFEPYKGLSSNQVVETHDSGGIVPSLESEANFCISSAAASAQTQTPKVIAKDSETQTNCKILKTLMEGEIGNLKEEIKKLKEENKDLRVQLDKSRTGLNKFKKIFTEGEVRGIFFSNKDLPAICSYEA